MTNPLRRAYGAGFRAGKSRMGQFSENPFTLRWQVLCSFAWDAGWADGMKQSLNHSHNKRRV